MLASSSSDKSEVEICSAISISETVDQLNICNAIFAKRTPLIESWHFQDDGSLGSISPGNFHDSSSNTETSPAGKEDFTAGHVNQEMEECITVEREIIPFQGEVLNLNTRKSDKRHIEWKERKSKHCNCKPSTHTTPVKNSRITRPKIISEYKHCVSLLEKYGIVSSPKLLKNQKFIPHVSHPGYVGDGVGCKRCKVCGAFEDANSTIICDECQEVFHLSCCLPRVGSDYFDKEDSWYCSYCIKQKRRADNARYFRLVESIGSVCSGQPRHNSKARLGTDYQADVPPWTGKVDYTQESWCVGCHGMGVSPSVDEKDADKEHSEMYKKNLLLNNWLPAKMLSPSTPENWLRCKSVFVKAFIDRNGRKHSEVICGKWRRAPSHVRQSDNWECFCVIEWDPSHADCSVPQELPTEEIMQRIQCRSAVTNGSNSYSINSE